MAATKIEVAYALFFFSFSMWIAILLSVCFQNGRWTNPVQFPSSTFLGMFVGSAAASSLACMIIGFEYLDLGKEFKRGAKVMSKVGSSSVRLRNVSANNNGQDSLSGDYLVLSNLVEGSENLSLLVLVSKKRRENFQVSLGNNSCQLEDDLIVTNSMQKATKKKKS